MRNGSCRIRAAPKICRNKSLLYGFFPVVQKVFEALIRQRMLEHLINNLRRNGGHMRARERGLYHVQWMAYGCGEHLRLVSVVVVNLYDVFDQLHAVFAYV